MKLPGIIDKIVFVVMCKIAFVLRLISHKLYMSVLVTAFNFKKGIIFNGKPNYIHPDVYLDDLGTIEIGVGFVVSTKVTILTHDFSYNVGLHAINKHNPNRDYSIRKKVTIGDHCFIGAGTIILPGSDIGDYCVVGAGSVVKGKIPSYSVVAGNPAKVICDTRDWGRRTLEQFEQWVE